MNILKTYKAKLIFLSFILVGLTGCLDECNNLFFAPKGCFPKKTEVIKPDCINTPLTTNETQEEWRFLFTGNDLDDNWTVVDGRGANIRGWNNKDGCINLYERDRDPALAFLDSILDFGYDVISGGNDIQARLPKNLVTKNKYQNFELKTEWKVGFYGNSGIHFRANPVLSWLDSIEMQIKDDENHPSDGSTAWLLSSNAYVGSSTIVASNPYGQWNRSHIIANGSSVKVFLNDTAIVDVEIPERVNAGVISFQDHWGGISFKNVKIKILD